ncbi:MAG: type III-B CRISPR module RAMP protein Cmr4 [Ignavibacteria bacterium]|nr:type III-B CRISPR module RAMP protein Cmr4 [Ignavibacteria bacterium]
MFRIAKPFYFRTISSLHCGSGNDLGMVDLPIQREKHTSFPKVESSSLKGAIREAFENKLEQQKVEFLEIISKNDSSKIGFENINDKKRLKLSFDYSIQLLFGYDEDNLDELIKKEFEEDSEFSGALAFSDARILFFPVRSAKGIFAWITCPYVLNRYVEDLKLCYKDFRLNIPSVDIGQCITYANNKISINNTSVVLEEYRFNEQQNLNIDPILSKFREMNELKERVVVLNDDDFRDFVNQFTEIITRTKIDNLTGTVAQGALFNEEYLPPETIMYFLVFSTPIFQKEEKKKGIFNQNGKKEEELVMEFFVKNLPEVMQLGGNATIGKGIIKINEINQNNDKGGK